MKKALIAALIFLGSCKSTDSIHLFAKSAGAGVNEISLQVTESPGESVDNSRQNKQNDSISYLFWHTLSIYFRLLQNDPDRKLLADSAGHLMILLGLVQTGTFQDKNHSEVILSSARIMLNTILNKNTRCDRYGKLVRTMKKNESALSFLIDHCNLMLDFSHAGNFKIQTSQKMLKLVQKDHYMLIFGRPPTGFAFTPAEISQDIVLINKMTANLRSFHPDANE